MSSAATPLHKTYAAIWIAFCAAQGLSLYFLPHIPILDLFFGAVFGVVEYKAIRTRKTVEWRGSLVMARDTLSEWSTFVARMAHPGTRWYQSWNAVVVILALNLSIMVARNVPQIPVVGPISLRTAIFGLMMGFLVFHWLRPDKVG